MIWQSENVSQIISCLWTYPYDSLFLIPGESRYNVPDVKDGKPQFGSAGIKADHTEVLHEVFNQAFYSIRVAAHTSLRVFVG